jgi:hypothetical protein
VNAPRKPVPLWRRLPRVVYWIAGGAISLLGAFGANAVAAQLPLQQKFWAWMVGSIFIFGGLMVLSMGTRSRLVYDDDDERENPTGSS